VGGSEGLVLLLVVGGSKQLVPLLVVGGSERLVLLLVVGGPEGPINEAMRLKNETVSIFRQNRRDCFTDSMPDVA
jgi:hypothetical protein